MLDRIGNCRIVDEVAAGGMAVVYRAIQDPLGRTVAIKALKTSLAGEESIVTRFEREAASLAHLQHENLITVYDFHREQGALYIVMEFVEGIDLYDLLERCGRLPYDVAAIIAMQVARALDYVHFRGIVHRDIKPANIRLSRAGGVKVMDFGIARDVNVDGLTEVGTGIGTPAYMSPEQILGDKLDARSDLFSLGILLYQMLTGRKPFVEDETHSVMHKIRLLRHEDCRKLNPEIPRELAKIIDRCLEKQPRDRWRSAQDVVFALERTLAMNVDMNHHARLVLFMRGQNLITQLEADEYVRPTVNAAGGVTAMPTRQAREAARRGLVAHGIMGGVLALMMGLIHVAPLGTRSEAVAAPAAAPQGKGYVRVVVQPWADVSVDGTSVGVAPMVAPLALAPGPHTLRLEHPYFAPIERTIDLGENAPETAALVQIDLARDGVPRADVAPRPADPFAALALEDEPLPPPPPVAPPTLGSPVAPVASPPVPRSTKKPTTKKPATKKPATKKPAAKRPSR